MADLVLWGRANSINVQKALWTLVEVGAPFERRDAGMAFGVVDTPEYRKLNPNGRVPTLVDGDLAVWESHAIIRYLAGKYGPETLYPKEPGARALVDRWLDWSMGSMQPAEYPLFWHTVRLPPAERDPAIAAKAFAETCERWTLVDAHLAGRAFVEGENLTLADIVLGCSAHRWMLIPGVERPEYPNMRAWYERLLTRPGYAAHVALPLA